MNECIEVRNMLETAALDRDGIERLEAGDTPEGARVAGHLAFCPPCAEELVRLRRTVSMLRAALAGGPAPALRERTLGFVRATGVERMKGGPTGTGEALTPRRTPALAPAWRRVAVPVWRRVSVPAWLAGAAAVLLVGAFGAGFLLRGMAGPVAEPTYPADRALARVAAAHARIMAAPDALEVTLADSAGTPRGVLAVAPSVGQMVVTATGLPPAPAGSSYGCWVEINGQRARLGTMYVTGDAAWWAGPVNLSPPIPPGTRFGVSLASADGSVSEPVLVGSN